MLLQSDASAKEQKRAVQNKTKVESGFQHCSPQKTDFMHF